MGPLGNEMGATEEHDALLLQTHKIDQKNDAITDPLIPRRVKRRIVKNETLPLDPGLLLAAHFQSTPCGRDQTEMAAKNVVAIANMGDDPGLWPESRKTRGC